MIDAILAVNVLPSPMQMFNHAICIWIMIIICVFIVCTCMTVSDFAALATSVFCCKNGDTATFINSNSKYLYSA